MASTATTTVPAPTCAPEVDVDRDDRTGHRTDEFGVAGVLVVGAHRGLTHLVDER